MTLQSPFPIYGYISSSVDGSWLTSATITAYGPDGTATSTPNSSGFYYINIQSICDDGDPIGISGCYNGICSGASVAPYSLDVSDLSKQANIRIYYLYGGTKDLQIFYGDQGMSDYIDCDCSRWDVQNYNIIVETWMKKSDLQTLRDNITPQAVGELYNILGRPRFYDKTWTGGNTLKLRPNMYSNSKLDRSRDDKIIYVKNITDSPLPGDNEWINVKIEGYISGQGYL